LRGVPPLVPSATAVLIRRDLQLKRPTAVVLPVVPTSTFNKKISTAVVELYSPLRVLLLVVRVLVVHESVSVTAY
jgi:hypothetical protein